MVTFPNAKINLGLRVLRKRVDGFHDIESCFLPVAWSDILEVVESDRDQITFSGLQIPGSIHENLCWKAFQILKGNYRIPPTHIHLHKVIPMGAGIGGGSSDAAFTIKSLNDLYNLGISLKEMEDYASQVGSDCTFFISNRTAIASGRGTDLKPFDLDLKGKTILLVNPGIHISTAEAYGKINIGEGDMGEVEKILKMPVENWTDVLKNDFEDFAFIKHPEIKELKERLYAAGALYSSMTGSGATVFGIFEDSDIHFSAENYTIWKGLL